jgi:hypothetical protein
MRFFLGKSLISQTLPFSFTSEYHTMVNNFSRNVSDAEESTVVKNLATNVILSVKKCSYSYL